MMMTVWNCKCSFCGAVLIWHHYAIEKTACLWGCVNELVQNHNALGIYLQAIHTSSFIPLSSSSFHFFTFLSVSALPESFNSCLFPNSHMDAFRNFPMNTLNVLRLVVNIAHFLATIRTVEQLRFEDQLDICVHRIGLWLAAYLHNVRYHSCICDMMFTLFGIR